MNIDWKKLGETAAVMIVPVAVAGAAVGIAHVGKAKTNPRRRRRS
jgi:hypothetical protein